VERLVGQNYNNLKTCLQRAKGELRCQFFFQPRDEIREHTIDRAGQDFDCATWVHKARSMPKEEFKREVEKELTGKETEPTRSFTSRSTGVRFR
jgi:hypothetical protein